MQYVKGTLTAVEIPELPGMALKLAVFVGSWVCYVELDLTDRFHMGFPTSSSLKNRNKKEKNWLEHIYD